MAASHGWIIPLLGNTSRMDPFTYHHEQNTDHPRPKIWLKFRTFLSPTSRANKRPSQMIDLKSGRIIPHADWVIAPQNNHKVRILLPDLIVAAIPHQRPARCRQQLSFNAGLSPAMQIYRKALFKLENARKAQAAIPANPNRRPRTGQVDCHIHNPSMIGVKITHAITFSTRGSVCTQFQSTSNHSRFTASAITNQTHSTMKTVVA